MNVQIDKSKLWEKDQIYIFFFVFSFKIVKSHEKWFWKNNILSNWLHGTFPQSKYFKPVFTLKFTINIFNMTNCSYRSFAKDMAFNSSFNFHFISPSSFSYLRIFIELLEKQKLFQLISHINLVHVSEESFTDGDKHFTERILLYQTLRNDFTVRKVIS